MIIPFQLEFIQLAFGKGALPFLFEAILQNHVINDFATKDAPPSEEFFTNTVKFLKNHFSTASITLHN